MKKILVLALFSFLGLGVAVAQVVEKRAEFPATQTELYVLDKLGSDGNDLMKAEAQVKAARVLHEQHLKAFVADVVKGHGIALKPGETIGWNPEGKAFFVTNDGAGATAPVGTNVAGPAVTAPASADVAPAKSAP